MRDIGVILLCVVATTLSLPEPQTLRPAPPPVAVRRPAPRPVGGVLRPAPRPVGGVLRPAPPLGGGLLGSLIGIGLLNQLLSRSDITTADLERSNEQGLGRILVRRPVYNRVRVVRRRPGLLGGLFGNLFGLGLGAGLVGSLFGRSDLPAADLEGAYSEDLVDAIIAREVDAAVLAGEDIDRNGDGKVDRNEFYWTFPELDLYQEFGKLDTDNSGFIELEEVDRATNERGRYID